MTPRNPPNNDPKKIGWCFVKGAAIGAAGAVAIGAVAVGAVTIGAPVAAVTAGLGVLAVAGAAVLGVDVANQVSSHNWAGVAYDAGSVVGSIIAGGVTAGSVRTGITGETSGGWNLKTDWAQGYRPNYPGGSFGKWMGTGPNKGSAAGSTTGAGSGLAGLLRSGC